MLDNKIGKMLGALREEAGISQKELARGLFTLADYSKIERGEREADKMHLEALFQRLGKSEDKLEIAIPIGEYRQISFRHNALQMLAIGKTKDADRYIKEYAEYLDMEKPLHLQSIMILKTVKEYVEHKNTQKTIKQLEETLEVTFPDWRCVSYKRIYLCRQEIQILLLILYLNLQIPTSNQAFPCFDRKNMDEFLEKFLDFLDEKCTDSQEQAKVIPQCLWLLGIAYRRQENIGKALEVCRRGIEILSENGVMAPMKELLKLKISCLGKMGDAKGIERCRNQIEALEFLYRIAERIYPAEEIVILLLSSMQGEVTVTNELIKEIREAKGISQEELCEGICTRETLSRIESGKRNPNKKKLFAMLKKMGIERETYYGYIIADDYRLYEKVRIYSMCEGKTKKALEEAEEAFRELDECLDRTYMVNRQFLEAEYVRREKKEDDWEYCLGKMKQILNYSMEDCKGGIYRVPFRQEAKILVNIAVLLRRLQRKEEALEIYRQIMERYEKSMVEKPFHATPLFLVYINYAGLLEVENHLEESEKVAKEGLFFSIECQRGDVAAEILANLSCVYEKRKNTNLAESCLKNSFYLLDLYQYEEECIMIKKIYHEQYSGMLD